MRPETLFVDKNGNDFCAAVETKKHGNTIFPFQIKAEVEIQKKTPKLYFLAVIEHLYEILKMIKINFRYLKSPYIISFNQRNLFFKSVFYDLYSISSKHFSF